MPNIGTPFKLFTAITNESILQIDLYFLRLPGSSRLSQDWNFQNRFFPIRYHLNLIVTMVDVTAIYSFAIGFSKFITPPIFHESVFVTHGKQAYDEPPPLPDQPEPPAQSLS